MTEFFHISIFILDFFWTSFWHRTVTSGSDSAPATLQPVNDTAPFFHSLHRKKALKCCALSFAFQFQHKVASPQQPMLPLQDSPGKAGSSVELGEMVSPCWEIPHPYQSPPCFAQIHTFPLPTQAVTAPPVPNPPPFWLQLLAAQDEAEDWEARVPPRGRILRYFPLIMVFSEYQLLNVSPLYFPEQKNCPIK